MFDELLRLVGEMRRHLRNGLASTDRVTVACSVEEFLVVYPHASDKLKRCIIEAAKSKIEDLRGAEKRKASENQPPYHHFGC